MRTDIADETLRHDGLDGRRHKKRLDAHVNQPRERARRVVRVQRAENQMPGQRRANGDFRRFQIANFTDHDYVRVLPQNMAQSHREGQTDFLFHTDPNFIKVILRNLVGNAIKFTPTGGVITLSGIKEKDYILLRVKDTGAGISGADLGNIFEWSSIRSDSSGLGLKLARDFAEKLGGRLSVQSEPGKGSEFIVTLPV